MSPYERADRLAQLAWRQLAIALALLLTAVGPAQAADEPNIEVSLPILVYHQIRTSADGPPDSVIAISLDRFAAQMRYLHEHGYTTLTTDQAVEFVQRGRAPSEKIVAIHFDDGWKSSLAALPILDRYGFSASFWIIAGTGIGWPHLDWQEVLSLAAHSRIEVQSHTWSHPWKDGQTLVDWINGQTPGKGIDDARRELVESRRLLEEKLGRPVRYLAWPRGLYDERLVQLAQQAGYRALFTADVGANHPGGDPLRMRRITIHGGCDLHVFAQLLADGVYRECGAIDR